MHVFFSVPMLGISKHVGMTYAEFTTKHRRLGNYIFDIGPGCRRFIPEAMCLVEEFTDEEWDKMEKEKAEAEAAKKASDEKAAASLKAEQAEVARKVAENEAWRKKPALAKLLSKKPFPEVA